MYSVCSVLLCRLLQMTLTQSHERFLCFILNIIYSLDVSPCNKILLQIHLWRLSWVKEERTNILLFLIYWTQDTSHQDIVLWRISWTFSDCHHFSMHFPKEVLSFTFGWVYSRFSCNNWENLFSWGFWVLFWSSSTLVGLLFYRVS